MRSQGYKSMEDATTINMDELTFLIVGKTGNGKSSLGNQILGKTMFKVSTSMASETTQWCDAVGRVNGEQVKVVDTPDPVNLDLSQTEISAEVARWKSLAEGKFAILLAVRCDVRYTAEEYDIYKKIKNAWGDNFTNHLVVVFTFGDRQDRDIHEELETVCWELRDVLRDAGNRYVIFKNVRDHNNEAEKQKLMNYAHAAVPPPFPEISKRLLLAILVFIIIIIALWFGLPWRSNVLKTPMFLLVFVVIIAGALAFVYRRRIVPFINIAMIINIHLFII